MPHWGEFERRQPPQQAPASEEDISEVFARHFNTPDGRAILEWIREQTKERIIPGGAPDSVLRQQEGQRELCDKIERMIEAGIARITGRNKAS